jgi:hypothetical protein
MKRRLSSTAILSLLVLAAGGTASRAAAQEAAPPPRGPVPAITVQGTGEVRADPDEATVRLGVVGQATHARAAQEKVNQVANAVIAALRALGVEAADLQTSELQLNPLYVPVQPGTPAAEQQKIHGYQASNVLSVRLVKLGLVGQAIDAGLGAGANEVQGVSFDLRDDTAARHQALELAAGEARGKAQAIAKALGVRLGEVLEAAEGGISTVAPQLFAKQAMAMADRSTPVAAGQLTISASVTIRYRINP